MFDFVRRLVRPPQQQSTLGTGQSGASGVSGVFGGVALCLIVTGLLTSERLVEMAERQDFGESRDRWLAAAEAVDSFSSRIGLDRPAAAIDAALGREEQESVEVVLGELAAEPTTTTTTTSTTIAPPTTGATPTPTSASTTTTVATTTTMPPPPILGDINVNQPLRIWTGGDSLGEYVGSELLYRVADTQLSTVELDFAISTGLARPDYFDWPSRFTETMQGEDRPNVVVFMVGGNDDQDLRIDGERIEIGTPEWRAGYAERVATMMDIAAYADVQMLWINLPPMRDDRRETISVEINAVLAAEADRRPWVQVIDIVGMFTGPDGGYEQFIDAPNGGATRNARAGDGVHITRQASNWVAELVWETIKAQWHFDYLTAATTSTTAPVEAETSTTAPSDLNGSSSSSDSTTGTGS